MFRRGIGGQAAAFHQHNPSLFNTLRIMDNKNIVSMHPFSDGMFSHDFAFADVPSLDAMAAFPSTLFGDSSGPTIDDMFSALGAIEPDCLSGFDFSYSFDNTDSTASTPQSGSQTVGLPSHAIGVEDGMPPCSLRGTSSLLDGPTTTLRQANAGFIEGGAAVAKKGMHSAADMGNKSSLRAAEFSMTDPPSHTSSHFTGTGTSSSRSEGDSSQPHVKVLAEDALEALFGFVSEASAAAGQHGQTLQPSPSSFVADSDFPLGIHANDSDSNRIYATPSSTVNGSSLRARHLPASFFSVAPRHVSHLTRCEDNSQEQQQPQRSLSVGVAPKTNNDGNISIKSKPSQRRGSNSTSARTKKASLSGSAVVADKQPSSPSATRSSTGCEIVYNPLAGTAIFPSRSNPGSTSSTARRLSMEMKSK